MGYHVSKASSSGVGNNGMTVAKTAASQDGTVIDLSDTPLRYGNNDTAISPKERAVLEEQEKKRLNAKVEYA